MEILHGRSSVVGFCVLLVGLHFGFVFCAEDVQPQGNQFEAMPNDFEIKQEKLRQQIGEQKKLLELKIDSKMAPGEVGEINRKRTQARKLLEQLEGELAALEEKGSTQEIELKEKERARWLKLVLEKNFGDEMSQEALERICTLIKNGDSQGLEQMASACLPGVASCSCESELCSCFDPQCSEHRGQHIGQDSLAIVRGAIFSYGGPDWSEEEVFEYLRKHGSGEAFGRGVFDASFSTKILEKASGKNLRDDRALPVFETITNIIKTNFPKESHQSTFEGQKNIESQLMEAKKRYCEGPYAGSNEFATNCLTVKKMLEVLNEET